MKRLLLTAVSLAVVSASFGQFKKLIVEQVDNQGKVPGNTYRIYAELSHAEDHVHAIYGDSTNVLQVKSTKPFFQHIDGGGLSREVIRKKVLGDETLKYDSWLTIGLEDNYVNQVNHFLLDQALFEFEEGNTLETRDGIWFATPDGAQVFARDKNRVLIMQLTSEGKIEGVINLQGRTVGHYADGREFANSQIADTERRRIGQSLRDGRDEQARLQNEIKTLNTTYGGTQSEKDARKTEVAALQKKLQSVQNKLREHEAAEKASGGEVWQAKGVTFTCGK